MVAVIRSVWITARPFIRVIGKPSFSRRGIGIAMTHALEHDVPNAVSSDGDAILKDWIELTLGRN